MNSFQICYHIFIISYKLHTCNILPFLAHTYYCCNKYKSKIIFDYFFPLSYIFRGKTKETEEKYCNLQKYNKQTKKNLSPSCTNIQKTFLMITFYYFSLVRFNFKQ